jgi:hypothetical protein
MIMSSKDTMEGVSIRSMMLLDVVHYFLSLLVRCFVCTTISCTIVNVVFSPRPANAENEDFEGNSRRFWSVEVL